MKARKNYCELVQLVQGLWLGGKAMQRRLVCGWIMLKIQHPEIPLNKTSEKTFKLRNEENCLTE